MATQRENTGRPRDDAAERLENHIAENRLPPHSRLPSERDMCEMWGCNRVTLRAAIRRLTSEGLLYSRKGSGTFVAPPRIVRNLQDLKSFSTVVLEAGREPSSRVVSLAVVESNKQVSQNLRLRLGSRVFVLVRVRLVDGAPAMLETSYMDYRRVPGIEKHDFAGESLYEVLERDYGVVPHRGDENVGITYCTAEEAGLLDLPEGAPVFFLTGLVSDADDVPVEYIQSVARSDQIRFAGVLTR